LTTAKFHYANFRREADDRFFFPFSFFLSFFFFFFLFRTRLESKKEGERGRAGESGISEIRMNEGSAWDSQRREFLIIITGAATIQENEINTRD